MSGKLGSPPKPCYAHSQLLLDRLCHTTAPMPIQIISFVYSVVHNLSHAKCNQNIEMNRHGSSCMTTQSVEDIQHELANTSDNATADFEI